MNYFKHSPLPKVAANRVRRHNQRNPVLPQKRCNKNLAQLDIMGVYAAREALQTKAPTRWRGGDEQDRREFIAAQKKRLGPGLQRVLSKSNKRMPSGHYLSEDRAFLEFNEVVRGRDILETTFLQPGKMQWSIEEFEKNCEQTADLARAEVQEKLRVTSEAVGKDMEEIEAYLGLSEEKNETERD